MRGEPVQVESQRLARDQVHRDHVGAVGVQDDEIVAILDQLSLSTMSRQLEMTISEAATKNLSVAATLERRSPL